MPSRDKVLAELDREKAQHLFERCTESTNAPKINGYSCEDCREIGETIRAALDSNQHEQVEEEYRVVADRGQFGGGAQSGVWDRERAEHIAAGWRREGFDGARLQLRTISDFQDGSTFISPWVDLDETGEGS